MSLFNSYDWNLPILNMFNGPEPDSFVIYGYDEFVGYNEHTEAKILYMQGFTKIGDNSFKNYPLVTKIVFDDNVTEFGNDINDNLRYLTILYLPKTVMKLSPLQAFDGTSVLSKVCVDKENQFFTDIDGILFTKDLKTLYFWPPRHGETIVYVPYGIVNIACAAFAKSDQFRKIFFPPTVNNVESWQFFAISNIEYIEFRNYAHMVNINKFHLLYGSNKDASIIHYIPDPISCKKPIYGMCIQIMVLFIFIIVE